LAASPAFGQPALAESPTIVFGETSPYAGFLVRFESEEKAFLDD
jgi:hypothetical protein